MGNEASMQRSKESRENEGLLKAAASEGNVAAVEALLAKDPLLVYAHTKDGKNIWHLAAEAGHTEVRDAADLKADQALRQSTPMQLGQHNNGAQQLLYEWTGFNNKQYIFSNRGYVLHAVCRW